jgi:hypothetical protein
MAFTSGDFGTAEADAIAQAYQREFSIDATVLHTSAGQGARLL